MEIVAVSNIKGGVGKTTTAVNFAYLAAASGRPTVVWDLDPQAAATYCLHGEPPAAAVLRGSRDGLPAGHFAAFGERAASG